MDPNTAPGPRLHFVPDVGIVERKCSSAVFLVHPTGIELLSNEVNAERRTTISTALFANTVLPDGHVARIRVPDSILRRRIAIHC